MQDSTMCWELKPKPPNRIIRHMMVRQEMMRRDTHLVKKIVARFGDQIINRERESLFVRKSYNTLQSCCHNKRTLQTTTTDDRQHL